MIFGSLVRTRYWDEQRWGQIFVWSGALTIVFAVIIWDFDQRQSEWLLTKNQEDGLREQLGRDRIKFPIVLLPLNNEPLANHYAYEFLSVMNEYKWRYLFMSPNWVPPLGADGIDIRVCPDLPGELVDRVKEHKIYLKDILDHSHIKYRDGGGTEEALNGFLVQAGERREVIRCPIGLVIGRPPAWCDRENPVIPWLPNPICIIAKIINVER